MSNKEIETTFTKFLHCDAAKDVFCNTSECDKCADNIAPKTMETAVRTIVKRIKDLPDNVEKLKAFCCDNCHVAYNSKTQDEVDAACDFCPLDELIEKITGET